MGTHVVHMENVKLNHCSLEAKTTMAITTSDAYRMDPLLTIQNSEQKCDDITGKKSGLRQINMIILKNDLSCGTLSRVIRKLGLVDILFYDQYNFSRRAMLLIFSRFVALT